MDTITRHEVSPIGLYMFYRRSRRTSEYLHLVSVDGVNTDGKREEGLLVESVRLVNELSDDPTVEITVWGRSQMFTIGVSSGYETRLEVDLHQR